MNGSLMIGKKNKIDIRNISFLLFLKKSRLSAAPSQGQAQLFPPGDCLAAAADAGGHGIRHPG